MPVKESRTKTNQRRDRRTRSRRWFVWEKAVAHRTNDRPAKRMVKTVGWREDLMYALCEEGDILENQTGRWPRYFYPRPPRGGRRSSERKCGCHQQFLSTPSARRATAGQSSLFDSQQFLSTPSVRWATLGYTKRLSAHLISIHALREEGDNAGMSVWQISSNFYPRPP